MVKQSEYLSLLQKKPDCRMTFRTAFSPVAGEPNRADTLECSRSNG